MNDRRTKFDIYVDILRLLNLKGGKAKPTHILYGANLSHPRLKKYLDSLLTEGFIQKTAQNGKTVYVLMMKGREFLSESKKVKQFSDAFGIQI
jgi:predicted transcriptional regulator